MVCWLTSTILKAIHAQLLREYGGLQGPVNEGALDLTLARPRHLEAYSNSVSTTSELAASYGYGFAKNHCFTDGNKRVALGAVDVFLQLNDYELSVSEPEAVLVTRQVASDIVSEQELAVWIRDNSTRL